MPNRVTDIVEPPGRIFTLDEQEGINFALFREFALRDRAFHSRSLRWPTELKRLPCLGKPIASGRNNWSETQVLRQEDALCHIRLGDGWARVSLAAGSPDDLDRAERKFRKLLPQPPRRTDGDPSTIMRFWSRGPTGARASARRIAVPRWGEIRANYPNQTVEGLEPLMNSWRPDASGQLLLWHGPPGTGKTYALRALTWQWRRWCEPHYIVDPEIFFADRPDYMLEVLLNNDDEDYDVSADDGGPQPPRWRLLILEDTGEMLAADAKEREGQGLSRLLNVVDGLIGQGLRVLVLVTGNEPLRRLHPAISRPGRCAANVEFRPFTREEAATWLSDHGMDDTGNCSGTLADLCAALAGRTHRRQRAIGFV